MTAEERVLGWDDQFEDTMPKRIVLPEGEYDFEVVHFERRRYDGGARLPACPMAVYDLKVTDNEGHSTEIEHRLFLHTRTQGFIVDFFVALGLMERDGKATMPWNQAVGRTGRAKVKVRKWTGDDGQERQNNEVDHFIDPPAAGGATYQTGSF